jgi:ankyrin repeat protein
MFSEESEEENLHNLYKFIINDHLVLFDSWAENENNGYRCDQLILNDYNNDEERTYLMLALDNKKYGATMATKLIQLGGINYLSDKHNTTLLMYACKNGHSE